MLGVPWIPSISFFHCYFRFKVQKTCFSDCPLKSKATVHTVPPLQLRTSLNEIYLRHLLLYNTTMILKYKDFDNRNIRI